MNKKLSKESLNGDVSVITGNVSNLKGDVSGMSNLQKYIEFVIDEIFENNISNLYDHYVLQEVSIHKRKRESRYSEESFFESFLEEKNIESIYSDFFMEIEELIENEGLIVDPEIVENYVDEEDFLDKCQFEEIRKKVVITVKLIAKMILEGRILVKFHSFE